MAEEEQGEAERRETEVITINCNNNFGFLKFISGDNDELKKRARVLKNGKYFDLPKKLEEQGRKKGWLRWEDEKAIRGYEEELQEARDEHDSMPLAGKTTAIEFDREIFIEHIEEAEKEEEKKRKIKEEKEQQEKKELEKKREEAKEEAERTGENVIVRGLAGCDGDIEKTGKELGWINVYEIATPDGEIKKEESPTY